MTEVHLCNGDIIKIESQSSDRERRIQERGFWFLCTENHNTSVVLQECTFTVNVDGREMCVEPTRIDKRRCNHEQCFIVRRKGACWIVELVHLSPLNFSLDSALLNTVGWSTHQKNKRST